jgi:regulator of protease activity HflC (stomatin/prohibitin superfamily)
VFVTVVISVQYQVVEENVKDAWYKLTDPSSQIRAYVEDVIRGSIPTRTLDEAFSSKDELAHAVKDQLQHEMKDFGNKHRHDLDYCFDWAHILKCLYVYIRCFRLGVYPKADLPFSLSSRSRLVFCPSVAMFVINPLLMVLLLFAFSGYSILKALVTDLSPDRGVKASMNEINAQKRLKDASTAKADGEKILLVKAAEADKEAKYLSGLGVAQQRAAIVNGLRGSIVSFSDGVDGTTPADVMDLLLLTQYFDTLKDIGASSGRKTLFLQHGPQAVADLQTTLKTGLMTTMQSKSMKR